MKWAICFVRAIHSSSLFGRPREWGNFPELSLTQMTWFDDDWGYSFPGWYTGCAMGETSPPPRLRSIVPI